MEEGVDTHDLGVDTHVGNVPSLSVAADDKCGVCSCVGCVRKDSEQL